MFFHKKQEAKTIPAEEINAMTKRGMSDKDIIKALKAKGYSYSDIEKAMLSAVKSGVSEEKPARKAPPVQEQEQQQDFGYDFGEEISNESFESMGTEDIFAGQEQQPQFEEVQQFQDLPQFSTGQQQPVEELVEGIVEEKWQHFQDELARVEEGLERLRADMKVFEERIDVVRKESPSNELEARLGELSDHLDDLDARVGGLERAFKQMLPSLTRNIESLSAMINEMKSKQEPKSFA